MNTIDFAHNLNFTGQPEGLDKILRNSVDLIKTCPDHNNADLKELAAEHFKIENECVTFGAGTTDIIFNLPDVFTGEKVLIPNPTFWEYDLVNRRKKKTIIDFELSEEDDFKLNAKEFERKLDNVDTVYLCNPNNPTSQLNDPDLLKRLIKEHPKTDFVIDETYLYFLKYFKQNTLINLAVRSPNLIVIFSFSKFFSIPGLRCGMMVSTADNIERYENIRTPYTISPLAPNVLEHVLNASEFIQNSRSMYKKQIANIFEGVGQLDSKAYKAIKPQGPFMLIKLLQEYTSNEIESLLANQGIIIRDCSSMKGLDNNWIRTACKKPEDLKVLFSALSKLTL